MASFKKTFGLLLCLSTCCSVNAFANVDTSGVAQLETTLPGPEGALSADQIPALSAKAIIADEAIIAGMPAPAAGAPAAATAVAPPHPAQPLHLQPGPPAANEPPATGH